MLEGASSFPVLYKVKARGEHSLSDMHDVFVSIVHWTMEKFITYYY